jgi:endonuclease YncB( thermonuclease family)
MKSLRAALPFAVIAALFLSACVGGGASSSALTLSAPSSSSEAISSSSEPSSSSASSSSNEGVYAFQAGSSLIFSEFDGGSSSSDRAVELSNLSEEALDLSAYTIAIYRGDSKSPTYRLPLSGSLAGKGVYVIASDTANEALKAKANLVSSMLINNGTFPMILLLGEKRVDTLGFPGYQTSWGYQSSIVRKAEYFAGADTFVADDWVYYAADDLSHLGSSLCPLSEESLLAGPRLEASAFSLPYIGSDGLGTGGVVEVSVAYYGDGDTTDFNYPASLNAAGYEDGHAFRYQNIDTPETQHGNYIQAQPWGYAAADFTNTLLRSASHILVQSIAGGGLTETYGRLLGFVWYTSVASPSASDYRMLNHQIVVNGYSKVAFSGVSTSQMLSAGLSYYSYLFDGNNHAERLGLKVHGEKDPNFTY